MWYREYKDYPPDTRLIQNPLISGSELVGCEMHERNGWGDTHHIPIRNTYRRKGWLERLFLKFFRAKNF